MVGDFVRAALGVIEGAVLGLGLIEGSCDGFVDGLPLGIPLGAVEVDGATDDNIEGAFDIDGGIEGGTGSCEGVFEGLVEGTTQHGRARSIWGRLPLEATVSSIAAETSKLRQESQGVTNCSSKPTGELSLFLIQFSVSEGKSRITST